MYLFINGQFSEQGDDEPLQNQPLQDDLLKMGVIETEQTESGDGCNSDL